MRSLFHPSVAEISLEGILHALSDPIRMAIFFDIVGKEYSQICSDFTNVEGKKIPKSTLSQQIKSLREAGLIRSERVGVSMYNKSRCDEIEQRFPGLIAAIINAYGQR